MPVLERPAVTLAYEDRGSGPPLVFLHGDVEWRDVLPFNTIHGRTVSE